MSHGGNPEAGTNPFVGIDGTGLTITSPNGPDSWVIPVSDALPQPRIRPESCKSSAFPCLLSMELANPPNSRTRDISKPGGFSRAIISVEEKGRRRRARTCDACSR